MSYFTKGKNCADTLANVPEKESDCKPGMFDFKGDDEVYRVEFNLERDANGKAKAVSSTPKATGFVSFVNLINGLGLKSSELAVGSQEKNFNGSEKDKQYMQGGHAYNLIVSEPYLTAFPHAIKIDDFEEFYGGMDYLPNGKIIKPINY